MMLADDSVTATINDELDAGGAHVEGIFHTCDNPADLARAIDILPLEKVYIFQRLNDKYTCAELTGDDLGGVPFILYHANFELLCTILFNESIFDKMFIGAYYKAGADSYVCVLIVSDPSTQAVVRRYYLPLFI